MFGLIEIFSYCIAVYLLNLPLETNLCPVIKIRLNIVIKLIIGSLANKEFFMRLPLLLIIFLLLPFMLSAQEGQKPEQPKKESKAALEKKTMSAVKLPQKPRIDGDGNEDVWENVPLAFSGNFTQVRPNNLEPSAYTTSIKVGYTDYAMYVLAYMKDPNPSDIARQLGLRDDFGSVADRFGIALDTYNQGQNAFYFAVTSAGVQLDLYITPNSEDVSWDAVWNSAVEITDDGWVAEFEIPWSAIRFAKRPEQLWGINFMRVVRSQNEEAFWSPVDASVSGFVNQSGLLRGVNDINPPLRLQLFPYVSAVAGVDRGSGESSTSFGGGMDVKWGISESFTLDMALIPDFSQVQSDNQVLNLSPFEVQYDENRPFFTEGTELFNKRDLFYSRRVGTAFNTFNPAADLPETSAIISRPSNAKLINATKISGRTHKGLGIGFFNAITNKTFIEVVDTIRNGEHGYKLEHRKLMMDPVTNFNIAVVDQNLPNNSSVSLINTNVTRMEGGRDANVTATEFRFRDKKNMFELEGFGALSYVWDNVDEDLDFRQRTEGHRYSLSFGKISGKFQFRLARNVETNDYDINDLGIIRANNEVNHYAWLGYRIFNPVWIINQGGLNLSLKYERLYRPDAFTSFGGNFRGWMQFKNFWNFSFGHSRDPVDSHDYFEPRTRGENFGYYFTRLPSYYSWMEVSSDRRKRFAMGVEGWMFQRKAWDALDWGIYVDPRLRISNKVSVNTGISYSIATNERGFVASAYENGVPKNIFFGIRDVQTLEPSVRLNVTFSNRMGLNIRGRYYWSQVQYSDQFFTLRNDGGLNPVSYNFDNDEDGVNDHNVNFNSFNIDLFYSWQVAPGSFLTFAWKDAAYEWRESYSPSFSRNIDGFLTVPHTHTFSVKFTYFLDYLMVRNWMQ